jgi:hypothetical protein
MDDLNQLPEQLVEDKSVALATAKFEADVALAIAKFKAEREVKPFSGRNPQLGKMVNCKICNHRHRSSITCLWRGKRAAGHGRPKGRINRHPNKRNLQLIQRTQELYDKYSPRMEPMSAMKCARAEAGRTLRAERKANRK